MYDDKWDKLRWLQ